jgi:crossover junction endodeoxyribonuclease RuvC
MHVLSALSKNTFRTNLPSNRHFWQKCAKYAQTRRAQGVAMAAAISRDIPIYEYAPLKIKMAITGNGRAAKEQVAYMLQQILHIPDENMLPQLDATDGLAAALATFINRASEMPNPNIKTGKTLPKKILHA